MGPIANKCMLIYFSTNMQADDIIYTQQVGQRMNKLNIRLTFNIIHYLLSDFKNITVKLSKIFNISN